MNRSSLFSIPFLLSLFHFAIPLSAQELTPDQILQIVRSKPDAFQKLEIPSDGSPARFEVKLGESTAESGPFVFDGFRLTVPEKSAGDLVWYFNGPIGWGQWYILPVEGEAKQGFRNWLDADKFYRDYDQVGEKRRLRVLQTLQGDYFEPGKEYILWFRRHDVPDPGEFVVRGAATFASLPEGKEEWQHQDIETVLKLGPLPAADQVKGLDSRGGRILLDERFFEPGYGTGRIEHVFRSIRETKETNDGFFVTLKTTVPACKKQPSFAEIVEAYGEPDFVRTREELARIGYEVDEDDAPVKAYYDYFGFELEGEVPNQIVSRVEAQVVNFSELRPVDPGKDAMTFGGLGMEHLMVFYQGEKEVGRAYYFLEDSAEPVFIQVPPKGTYRLETETIICKGDGNWEYTSHYPNGKLSVKHEYKNNIISGKSEKYHPDGSLHYVANYENGQLEGEFLLHEEDGSITRYRFEKGQRVE